ncbi:hypothetical protein A1WU_00077 [Escherichia coli KTE108]|nr:hypothetical protein A1WU_00077 [Escherichia coli KTE108]
MKMPAFEWVHVQLHQQKGMISLSPPTICNSADVVTRRHEQLVVELGLEETAARRLLDVCYARSDAWEKENGGTIYVR